MAKVDTNRITLEDAKQLVALLEAEDQAGAEEFLDTLTLQGSEELFAEVGKLTRQLHDSLNNFQIDTRLASITKDEIPDAQTRLTYVIEETEKAANVTMDAVEQSMPLVEEINTDVNRLLPEWKKLMARQIELGDFKALCHDLDTYLHKVATDSESINRLMTEVLMAQGFQDITGQIIRRVIELVKEVEDNLVHMLTMFGGTEVADSAVKKDKESSKQPDTVKAEGPIINPEQRDDVVTGQDDVDDLLSSLGF